MRRQKTNGTPIAPDKLEALGLSRDEILQDYRIAVRSRQPV